MTLPGPEARREAVDSLLAKNLVVARILTGMTQQELARASSVSRATIAQLETGYSDPRLSTVVELAAALDIPPIFLLLGVEEVRALAALVEGIAANTPRAGATPDQSPALATIPTPELARMHDYLSTGMLKDRLRAARVGAAVAQAAGTDAPATAVAAGIFSAILPGAGTVAGIALARCLDRQT